jgi:hypothetical protein
LGWGVDVNKGFDIPPLSLALSSRRGDKTFAEYSITFIVLQNSEI